MFAKPVVAGILAVGCLGAAAIGGYVAVRQNAADEVATTLEVVTPEFASPEAAPAPVSESEVAITPPEAEPADTSADTLAPAPSSALPVADVERPQPPRSRRREIAQKPAAPAHTERAPVAAARREPPRATRGEPAVSEAAPAERSTPAPAIPEPAPGPLPSVTPPPSIVMDPPPPPKPEFVEVVVPAASVIGLRIESTLSTERAEVEDRVDARVTRDVTVDGRVAIPAGSRVIGAVTTVERGGKIKERARLGVRFHTLVFADGLQLPIRTEAIYREGESPANSSSKKIGGAAVGGAILGAILGGGKGAAIGGAAGAAGGTAAAMAGDRRSATLPAGSLVTVRLSEPITLEVEKH